MACTTASPKCGGQMVRGECYGRPACPDSSWTWLKTDEQRDVETTRTARREGPCYCGNDPCRCR